MRIRLDGKHAPDHISTNDMGVARKQLDKVYRLDLSYQKRAEVPEEIGEMVHLTDLELHGNYFKDIDRLLQLCGRLPKLRYLTLDLDAHPRLPASIGGLKALEWLILSGKEIGPLPDEMAGLEALKTLYLWVNKWSGTQPHLKPLGHLPLLRTLSLELWGTTVPLGMEHLAKVDNFQSKNLPSLPPGFGQMAGLREVELHFNKDFAPAGVDLGELNLMAHLESLKIATHARLHFPDSLAGMLRLEGLDLGNTQLSAPPAAIGTLPALKYLLLNENGISRLPDWIADMKSLEGLNLDDNQLEALPDTLAGATALRRIGLEKNKFARFPKVLLEMPGLEKVDLGRNRIADLPDVTPKALRLKSVSLRLNKLEAFPWPLASLPHAALDLEGNPFCKSAGYKIDVLLHRISDAGHALPRRQALLALAMGDMERALATIGLDDLLTALDDKEPKLRALAQAALARFLPSPFTDDAPPKEVRILGPTKDLPLDTWKAQLAKQGIGVNKAKPGGTDIVVIAERPGSDAAEYIAKGAKPAAVQHLADWLDKLGKPWLKQKAEEKPEVAEQVSRLLATATSENIALALGMLKSGGAPLGLLSAVLAISLIHPDDKVRKQATQIVEEQASTGLKAHLQAHKRNVLSMTDEKRLAHLATLGRHGEVDGHRFGKMLVAIDSKLTPVFLPHMQAEDVETLRDRNGYIRIGVDVLPALPDNLASLPNIDALKLLAHEKKNVPAGLERLVGLKRLDLSSFGLSRPPEEIEALQGLEVLDISSNHSLKEFPGFVMRLPCLRVLEAGYNSFKTVPEEIKNKESIEELGLETVNWKKFPLFLTEMTQLRKLALTRVTDECRQLGPLPQEMARLSRLESLHIGGHAIGSLPDWMGAHRWKVLLVEENGLSRLPDWLWGQAELEWLDISRNKEVVTLGENIGQCKSLRAFDISGTAVERLPDSFAALTGLRSLYVSRSRLADDDHNIAILSQLKGLEHLYCHDLGNGLAQRLRQALPQTRVMG